MKKLLSSVALASAVGVSLLPATASAFESAEFNLNWVDVNTQLGVNGVDATVENSALVNSYDLTAESLVLFNDEDNSGDISEGDTFDDFIFFTIDLLKFDGISVDTPYRQGQFQITGLVYGTGVQGANDTYTVDSSIILFYADAPAADFCFATDCGSGTAADFADLGTFQDGVLTEFGLGGGVGSSDGIYPNGDINLFYSMYDLLSTFYQCGPEGEEEPCGYDQFELGLELSDEPGPFGSAEYQSLTLKANSDNEACTLIEDGAIADPQPGGLTDECNSTVQGITDAWNSSILATQDLAPDLVLADYDFGFHTISDGSAVKNVPIPGTVALLGLGLLAGGMLRRKKAA